MHAEQHDVLGHKPTPDAGLYALACSVNAYCAIIRPWGAPIVVFGDDPSDIYWSPDKDGGVFVRWIGAESLEQLRPLVESNQTW